MSVFGQMEKSGANEWTICQVERLPSLLTSQLPDDSFALVFWQCTQVCYWTGKRLSRGDHLRCPAIYYGKSRSHDLVPSHDFVQALLKYGKIERTNDQHGVREIISWTFGYQLIDEPHSLLSKRQRNGTMRATSRNSLYLRSHSQFTTFPLLKQSPLCL